MRTRCCVAIVAALTITSTVQAQVKVDAKQLCAAVMQDLQMSLKGQLRIVGSVMSDSAVSKTPMSDNAAGIAALLADSVAVAPLMSADSSPQNNAAKGATVQVNAVTCDMTDEPAKQPTDKPAPQIRLQPETPAGAASISGSAGDSTSRGAATP